MRILVAAQEFKGSLTAAEACDAIALGIRDGRPDWEVDVVPLSDGGPGFLDAFLRSPRARERWVDAEDALGHPTHARYVELVASGDVIIESAQSNSLTLIPEEKRDALAADTAGVGQLLAAAVRPDTRRVIVGVGGSATSDGGTGMARSLGASLLDHHGNRLGRGVLPLLGLARIVWEPAGRLTSPAWVVATDVTAPLLGPRGAAAVYGPQKGAGPDEVRLIEQALARFAQVASRDLHVDLGSLPGAGAGGGLAAGLVAFLGGEISSGFDVVERISGLRERVQRADVAVTGEGRFDNQSLSGKGPARLIELAERERRPAVVFAGSAGLRTDAVHTIERLEPDLERAMRNAAPLLRRLAEEWSVSFG